jgi:alpha-1,3-rhamnosyl/mannosyltransferase
MTTVEALACGLPVIAADRGGLGDVARDGAYMIKEPTVAALSDAMNRVLGTETLRQELRLKAVKKAEQFRWDKCAQQTLEVLRA